MSCDPKGVIEQEHTNTGTSAFDEDVPQRVPHPSRMPVIQLKRDGPPRRPQILPETFVRAVAI